MKQIILFPKGTLSREAKKQIASAGAVAVEVEDPSKVVMIIPCASTLTGDIALTAALNAILGTGSSAERERFGKSIAEQILKLPKPTHPLPTGD